MVSQRGVLNLFHSDGAAQRLGAARQRHAAVRHRRRTARSRAGARILPLIDIDNARFPIMGGLVAARAAAGAARCRGLGLRARGRCARGRYHPALRGHRHRREGGRVTGVRTTRGSSARARSGWRSPATPRGWRRWPGWTADRKPCAAGLRQRGRQAADPFGGHLRRRAFLHQPVRQGRAGVRRRSGRLQFSYAQRGNLPMLEDVWTAGIAMMPVAVAAARSAQLGRRDGHDDRRLARSSAARRSKDCTSTPAGAMAASRRRRPPAGASPGRSPRTSRTS